jgi:hypothetical protein
MDQSAMSPVMPVRLDPDSVVRTAVYEAPAIIYETPLEVRAGSPLSLPDPLDLTN